MAKPKIFISSTFYDLKHVRNDIESFLRSVGYDPIMNERGNIPYSADRPLETSCLQEIAACDILLGIIGGVFGSSSIASEEHSISMEEIQTAISQKKQIFICVEKSVWVENKFYLQNKDNLKVKYSEVNDIRIHDFIAKVKSLPQNNAIIPFESTGDIINFIREQFAGLFQKLLQEKSSISSQSELLQLDQVADKFIDINNKLEERELELNNQISNYVWYPHLAIFHLNKLLGIKSYTILVHTKEGIIDYLRDCSFFKDEGLSDETKIVFIRRLENQIQTLSIDNVLFDEKDNLIPHRNLSEVKSKIQYHEEDDSSEPLPFDL